MKSIFFYYFNKYNFIIEFPLVTKKYNKSLIK